VAELIVPGSEALLARVPGSGPFWWADKLLKLYDSLPRQPGRARARRRVVDWIVARQEADGSWGGIQPPWVYSLIALHLEGMSLDHPVMRRGLDGQRGFVLDDRDGWRFQACMSPVWDTAWAMLALRRAGIGRDHESMRRAVRWILGEQIHTGGDWQVRCGNDVPCGGWAFEFANDIYPDIDDTAVVVLALREAGYEQETRDAVRRAVEWVLVTRSRNGAWGAFDKDNTRELVYRLPFADFGALLDPPTEDVTAHVLEMLACAPASHRRAIAGGLAYLRRTQRPDGAWFGRWGVNYIYGTWCVISALAALRDAGYDVQTMIARGCSWLLAHQNDDGGWGETCVSYEDSSFAGVGPSTPSQSAWAILALQAAGLGDHPACRRGLAHLRATQVDGTWDEREHTGTGFPRDFYIKYHLYRHLFPTMALAGAALHTQR
jgi:squalene-hopene/tetraprenyl-beta-curcumene cyclase